MINPKTDITLDDEADMVLVCLQSIIRKHQSAFYGQYVNPMGDIDQSDQIMSDAKKDITRLRQIREELENLFSGYPYRDQTELLAQPAKAG